MKNQHWLLPTCDSFPLIAPQLFLFEKIHTEFLLFLLFPRGHSRWHMTFDINHLHCGWWWWSRCNLIYLGACMRSSCRGCCRNNSYRNWRFRWDEFCRTGTLRCRTFWLSWKHIRTCCCCIFLLPWQHRWFKIWSGWSSWRGRSRSRCRWRCLTRWGWGWCIWSRS